MPSLSIVLGRAHASAYRDHRKASRPLSSPAPKVTLISTGPASAPAGRNSGCRPPHPAGAETPPCCCWGRSTPRWRGSAPEPGGSFAKQPAPGRIRPVPQHLTPGLLGGVQPGRQGGVGRPGPPPPPHRLVWVWAAGSLPPPPLQFPPFPPPTLHIFVFFHDKTIPYLFPFVKAYLEFLF